MMKKREITDLGTYKCEKTLMVKGLEKEKSHIAVGVTILAILLDFANVFQRYNTINREGSPLLLLAMTMGTVFLMDVPLSYAGTVLSEFNQGLRSKRDTFLIVLLAVIAFLGVAIPNVVLGNSVGVYMLEDPAVASAGILESNMPHSNAISVGSMILSILFVWTSLASFAISYYCCDGLLHKINVRKEKLFDIENNLLIYHHALAKVFANEPDLYEMGMLYHRVKDILSNDKEADWNKIEEDLNHLMRHKDKFKAYFSDNKKVENLLNQFQERLEIIQNQKEVRRAAYLEALGVKVNTPEAISKLAKVE